MEAKYVHKPAVAPGVRSMEDSPDSGPIESHAIADPPAESLMDMDHPVLGEAGEGSVDRPSIPQLIESQIRAHPLYAIASGFVLGLVLGVVLRR